jgi:farnesyl diphosphate synthase
MVSTLPFSYDYYKNRLEQALEKFLPLTSQEPSLLHQAMRYSALSPGKRLRPTLTYLVGKALGTPYEILDYPAAAIEIAHAFSLIHDDLPALDNDDIRRGIPTCHKKFDEATAILAGDALLVLAFRIVAQTPILSAERALSMVSCLTESIGSQGVIGGEFLDIQAERSIQTEDFILKISEWKTARLIQSAIMLGVLTCPTSDLLLQQQFDEYARNLGIAFQIQDDILGVKGNPSLLGKSTNSDKDHQKATLPLLKGVPFAEHIRDKHYNCAQEILLKLELPVEELITFNKKMIYREF